MKKLALSRYVLLDAVSMLLVLLFIYAALNKIIEFDRFQTQIGKSPLIMNYSKFFAVAVPASEILISVMLLVPKLRLIGLFASYTIMLTFTMYIAFILTFSPYVPCSCGGILNNLGWTEHLVFNIVFTLLALLGVAIHRPSMADSPKSDFKEMQYKTQL